MWQSIIDFLNHLPDFLSGPIAGILATALAFVVAKLVPSDKAGPLSKTLFLIFDSVAEIALAIGSAAHAIGTFLHSFLKSDGLNGVK